jgi:hypothetical protein
MDSGIQGFKKFLVAKEPVTATKPYILTIQFTQVQVFWVVMPCCDVA